MARRDELPVVVAARNLLGHGDETEKAVRFVMAGLVAVERIEH